MYLDPPVNSLYMLFIYHLALRILPVYITHTADNSLYISSVYRSIFNSLFKSIYLFNSLSLSLSLSLSHTHTHTHPLSLSLTHTLSHSLSVTHSLSVSLYTHTLTHAASPHIIGGRGRDGAFSDAAAPSSEEGDVWGIENNMADLPPGTEYAARGALLPAVLQQGVPLWGAVGDLSPRALRLVPGLCVFLSLLSSVSLFLSFSFPLFLSFFLSFFLPFSLWGSVSVALSVALSVSLSLFRPPRICTHTIHIHYLHTLYTHSTLTLSACIRACIIVIHDTHKDT